MPYPKRTEIEIPLLAVLEQLGGEAAPRDIYPKLAKHFDLSEEEQDRRMEGSPSNRKWWNLVQWARQTLVDQGEIDRSVRGIWKVTHKGRARLKAGEPPRPRSPEVSLRDLVNENLEEMKTRLVHELQQLSSSEFEKFCAVFLQQLGYESLEVTRRNADGGIDGWGDFRQGVVRIRSAFQAKRYQDNAVGRPEIDKFRGAIQGEFDHGVFLTTSRFTREAEGASVKKGAIPILLLDGRAIAALMLDKGLGVIRQPVYLAEVNSEFFDFKGEAGGTEG